MTRGAASLHTSQRAPSAVPPFTVGSLRKAIPKHCFERSAVWSFGYVIVDLLLAAGLFAFSQVIETRAPTWLAIFAWPIYWFFQVLRPAHFCLNRLSGWFFGELQAVTYMRYFHVLKALITNVLYFVNVTCCLLHSVFTDSTPCW